MKKLLLDYDLPFKDGAFYQALMMAIALLEQASDDHMRSIAEQSIESLVMDWLAYEDHEIN